MEPPEEKKGWRRLKTMFSLTHKNATPIEWEILILVFAAMFSSCYSITYIFPFLPDMILYFGYTEEEKGYYSGIIASGIFAGRIVSSYFWGWLSDRHGRKPVLIVCMILTSITNALFGLCTNVAAAFTVRMLNGLGNGMVVIAKTILYEVSDNSNQAAIMAIIGLAWGAGIILGPLVSGYLAFPADRYPAVFAESGVFGQWPFLLPSIVGLLVGLLWVPLIILRLPETRNRRKTTITTVVTDNDEDQPLPKEEITSPSIKTPSPGCTDCEAFPAAGTTDTFPPPRMDMYSSLPDVTGAYSPDCLHCMEYIDGVQPQSHCSQASIDTFMGKDVEARNSPRKERAKEDGAKSPGVNGMESEKALLKSPEENTEKDPEEKSPGGCCGKLSRSSLAKIIRMKEVRDAVAIYSLVSFAAIGWDECFTVFSSTSSSLDGLGFRPDQIGTALGLSSTPLIVIQVFLFPYVEKRFGAKKCFEYFALILIFMSSTMISVRALRDNSAALWGLLLVMMALMKISQVTCFTATSLFINNSVTPDLTGSVNGLAMTMTAVLRTLAPTVGGALFSWSITVGRHIGFPLDVNLVFLLFSFVYLLGNIVCAQMSNRVDKQKKVQDSVKASSSIKEQRTQKLERDDSSKVKKRRCRVDTEDENAVHS